MYLLSHIIFLVAQFECQLTFRAHPGAVFYPACLPQGRKTLEIRNYVNSVNVMTVY